MWEGRATSCLDQPFSRKGTPRSISGSVVLKFQKIGIREFYGHDAPGVRVSHSRSPGHSRRESFGIGGFIVNREDHAALPLPGRCVDALSFDYFRAGRLKTLLNAGFPGFRNWPPGKAAPRKSRRVVSSVMSCFAMAWTLCRRSGDRPAIFSSSVLVMATHQRNKSARTWKRCANRFACSLLISREPDRISDMRPCETQSPQIWRSHA